MHLLEYIGWDIHLDRSGVLNSCIGVGDYNEPYLLCQPLLPLPGSTLGLTRPKPSGNLPRYIPPQTPAYP
jgi:hypothetical protein